VVSSSASTIASTGAQSPLKRGRVDVDIVEGINQAVVCGRDGDKFLSADVLALVFKWVGHIEPHTLIFVVPTVCKRWRAVCESHVDGVRVSLGMVKRITSAAKDIPVFVTSVQALVNRFHSVRTFALELDMNVPAVCVDAVAAGCPRLTSLDLRGCSNVVDAGIERVALCCPNLTSLDLGGCENVTDAGIEVVAASCPNLESLDLQYCENVTDTGLATVAVSCSRLRSLNLYDCYNVTDVALARLAAGCLHLALLDLTGCESVSDAGLATLVLGCPKLLPHRLASRNKGDLFLAAVARTHPHLTWLNLRCCNVTGWGLEQLVAGCPSIDWLNLDRCKHVTDEGLAKLVARCPYLLPDRLASDAKGDLFLAAVASVHPNLKALNLQHCSSVTDVGLHVLATGCLNLTSLNLACYNSSVSDAGVERVAACCPNLTALDLQFCQHVSNAMLAKIKCIVGGNGREISVE
jgi:hypothetical protein